MDACVGDIRGVVTVVIGCPDSKNPANGTVRDIALSKASNDCAGAIRQASCYRLATLVIQSPMRRP